MKKMATLVSASLLFALSYTSQAQSVTCCTPSIVAPELTPGFHPTQIGLADNTPAPVLGTVAVGLSTTEYIVTKRSTPALSDIALGVPDTVEGGGDVIIGASADGIFMPTLTRYGVTLNPGDTFDITAVGYNLALLKTLADSLLNGYVGSTPCCDLFILVAGVTGKPEIEGFCDSVNNAGIYNANDLNNMNDVLTIFDQFSNGQLSIGSILATLKVINDNGHLISADCGGTGQKQFLPYGINRDKVFGYDREGTVAVRQLSTVSSFAMFPNPAINNVQIMFTTSQEVDLNINVYNAFGQRVLAQTMGNVSGNINTQLEMANFAAGMYYVELTDGHSSQTHKLMVK